MTQAEPQSQTPHDVQIKPRHPKFALDEVLATDWNGGDAFRTALFNALSLTLPTGETYVIDAVREFQAEVTDPKLRQEVRGFIGQEAIHRREHGHYNTILTSQRGGGAFEQTLREETEALGKRPRFTRLMETVIFEHMTAVWSHGMLTDERWLAGADDTLRRMWIWHAIEEAEHKAVTFDVYRAAGGDMDRLQQALWPVTMKLLKDILQGTWVLLKADGKHLNPALWWRGLSWLFGRNGVVRALVPMWKEFRRAAYHPWDHDNRALIDHWRKLEEPDLLAA